MTTLKDQILLTLTNQPNQFVSGEQLAVQFNVSRTAIWKAIQQLKKQGYSITAISQRGYRLTTTTDILSAQLIQAALEPAAQIFSIDYEACVDSTNNCAKNYIATGTKTPKVFLADEQTAGRGRVGRQFHSPAKTGLYLSLCYFPDQSLHDLTLLTSATAVAVYRAVLKVAQRSLQIKWVNDLYIADKKVVGILTEVVTDLESRHVAGVVVGIGINIQQPPEGLFSNTSNLIGSLCGDDPPSFTRNQLAAAIINEWVAIINKLPERAFLEEYRQQSLILGKEVTVYQATQSYTAHATAIDENGCLLVVDENNQSHTLSYGEISIRPQSSDSSI